MLDRATPADSRYGVMSIASRSACSAQLEKQVSPNHNFGPGAGGRAYLSGGQLSAAIAATLKYDPCPAVEIYWAHMFGKVQLPEAAHAALQAGAPSSSKCPRTSVFIAGAYASDQAQWARFANAQKLLLTLADSSGLAGDSANAAWLRPHAEALHGYELARAGNLDTAIQVLEAIQPRLGSVANKIVRWWLGDFLLQANRPLEARKYFASFWDWQHGHPIPASFYLARIDEQLGQLTDARAKYARFEYAWRNADREIQPRVAEARARLAALPLPRRPR